MQRLLDRISGVPTCHENLSKDARRSNMSPVFPACLGVRQSVDLPRSQYKPATVLALSCIESTAVLRCSASCLMYAVTSLHDSIGRFSTTRLCRDSSLYRMANTVGIVLVGIIRCSVYRKGLASDVRLSATYSRCFRSPPTEARVNEARHICGQTIKVPISTIDHTNVSTSQMEQAEAADLRCEEKHFAVKPLLAQLCLCKHCPHTMRS